MSRTRSKGVFSARAAGGAEGQERRGGGGPDTQGSLDDSDQRRLWIILTSVTLLLLLLNFLKGPEAFTRVAGWMGWTALQGSGQQLLMPGTDPQAQFAFLLWWFGWHILLLMAVPVLIIRHVFCEPLAAFGWGWGESARYARHFIILLLVTLPLVVVGARTLVPAGTYPLFPPARTSMEALLVWEGCYLLQFVALEFFFRGFLLQGLRGPLGASAIAVTLLPYAMLHWDKPWPEAMGSLVFGAVLGLLALASRSFLGGVFVHAGIALAADLAGLADGFSR